MGYILIEVSIGCYQISAVIDNIELLKPIFSPIFQDKTYNECGKFLQKNIMF